ncbi:30S ribosomal protein S6e [Candidatus Pacearchaeota archaeon]|nr:30S ribosomal protein S6e [Candidatus Pacearchaeota archaeon]
MPFKINISHKGKTYKLETESEVIVGKKIGETIKGEDIASNLEGYEIEITGISDIAGLPGFKGLEGTQYHRRLLTRGPGMHNTKKGLRLRKTNRGEEISLKISQINTKVIKQGKTKFADLLSPKTEEAETPAEAPAETHKEEPKEKPTKEKKEEPKVEEEKKEEKEISKE